MNVCSGPERDIPPVTRSTGNQSSTRYRCVICFRKIARGVIPSGTGKMAIGIGRRDFISAIGGATVAWPLAAHAQRQAVMPVIGFLSSAAFNAYGEGVSAFRRGLIETGFNEGQNVTIEYRSAEGQYDLLPALASDLVDRKVSVLATAGGIPPARAAKVATTTIPIVFVMGSDPIKAGVVAGLNRPEGDVTGVSFLINSLGTKRIELISQLAKGFNNRNAC